MKFFSTLAVALTVALPVLAQDLSGLPACAEQATVAGIGSTGCALTDIKCICSAKSFLAGLAAELPKVCSAADIAKTDAFAAQLCDSAGVTLPIPSATSASSSTAAVTAITPTSSTSAITVAPSSSVSVNATVTTSGPPVAFTGAATQVRAGVMGVIAMGMGLFVGL